MKQKYIFHLEVLPNTFNRVLAMPAEQLADCYQLLKRWCECNCETKGYELKSIESDKEETQVVLFFISHEIKFKVEKEEII